MNPQPNLSGCEPNPKEIKQIDPPPPPSTLQDFVSVSWKPIHGNLYQKIFQLILDKGLFYNGEKERAEPPYKFRKPEELESLIDFKLGKTGTDQETLYKLLEKVIEYSPHQSHPFFLDKIATGLDPFGLAADIIAAIMSTAVLTYFFAPVFTLMEEEVKKQVREMVGYPKGKGDGLIGPGPEFVNMMALRMAIQKKYSDIGKKGFSRIGRPKICVFISEHSSKSFERAAIMTGIGTSAVIPIKTDKSGRMDLTNLKSAFDSAINAKFVPLMVVGTVGTPILGAIDPIDELAIFCKENKLWLHVDADYGGSYLFSTKNRELLKGIERSHSFNLSPCGMMGAPFCCNVLVTKYDKLCFDTFGLGAEYVFEKTDLYDEKWDNGDGTIQTSRRGLILKFWFMWKAKGKAGLGKHVDYVDSLSKFFVSEIRERGNGFSGKSFQLILEKFDTPRISFYYVPASVRFLDRRLDYLNPLVTSFAKKLKTQLLLKGIMELGISSLPGYPDFFTISVTNSALTKRDLAYILDQIEYYGQTLNPLSVIFLGEKILKESAEASNKKCDSEVMSEVQPILKAGIPNPPKEYPSFVSAPIETMHKELFTKLFALITKEGLYFQNKRKDSPFNFREPEKLLQEFDFKLGNDGIQNEEELLKILSRVIYYSIHQAHPYYLFQLLSGGLDPYSIMAETVLMSMTSPMLTYEDSPVYTLMEREVFRAVRDRIGFPSEGDGLLCPGGSVSVITAIAVARVSKFPELKSEGFTGGGFSKKLVLYISIDAHYCYQKGSSLQGIGIDQVVLVDVDDSGKMMPSALEAAIKKTINEGGTPFLVGATAGTTVLGVFDPTDEMADICKKYDLWLHIDASIGGSYMMSDKILGTHLKGIERSDSFNFNPHKAFGLCQETSILVFRKKDVIEEVFGTVDPYNFPPPTFLYNYQKYDSSGQGGMQKTRRNQILKIWLVWKAKGITGMGKHVDYTYGLKDMAVKELKKRVAMFKIFKPDFEMPVAVFHYVPPSLRSLDRNSQEFKEGVEKILFPLTAEMVRAGAPTIGILRDPQKNLVLKLVLMSSGVTGEDIKYVLDQIDNYGNDL